MTNAEMAELLLKQAERIDATNASGMTADYVRELAEEAVAMRAGAEALQKLDSPDPRDARIAELEAALRVERNQWESAVSGGWFYYPYGDDYQRYGSFEKHEIDGFIARIDAALKGAADAHS